MSESLPPEDAPRIREMFSACYGPGMACDMVLIASLTVSCMSGLSQEMSGRNLTWFFLITQEEEFHQLD